jgi:hypothetical protein
MPTIAAISRSESAMDCPVIHKLTQHLQSMNQGDDALARVIDKLKQRSEIGWTKYHATLARKDVTHLGWLNHAQREALDLVGYIEAICWHHGESACYREMQEDALSIATIIEAEIQRIDTTLPSP